MTYFLKTVKMQKCAFISRIIIAIGHFDSTLGLSLLSQAILADVLATYRGP